MNKILTAVKKENYLYRRNLLFLNGDFYEEFSCLTQIEDYNVKLIFEKQNHVTIYYKNLILVARGIFYNGWSFYFQEDRAKDFGFQKCLSLEREKFSYNEGNLTNIKSFYIENWIDQKSSETLLRVEDEEIECTRIAISIFEKALNDYKYLYEKIEDKKSFKKSLIRYINNHIEILKDDKNIVFLENAFSLYIESESAREFLKNEINKETFCERFSMGSFINYDLIEESIVEVFKNYKFNPTIYYEKENTIEELNQEILYICCFKSLLEKNKELISNIENRSIFNEVLFSKFNLVQELEFNLEEIFKEYTELIVNYYDYTIFVKRCLDNKEYIKNEVKKNLLLKMDEGDNLKLLELILDENFDKYISDLIYPFSEKEIEIIINGLIFNYLTVYSISQFIEEIVVEIWKIYLKENFKEIYTFEAIALKFSSNIDSIEFKDSIKSIINHFVLCGYYKTKEMFFNKIKILINQYMNIEKSIQQSLNRETFREIIEKIINDFISRDKYYTEEDFSELLNKLLNRTVAYEKYCIKFISVYGKTVKVLDLTKEKEERYISYENGEQILNYDDMNDYNFLYKPLKNCIDNYIYVKNTKRLKPSIQKLPKYVEYVKALINELTAKKILLLKENCFSLGDCENIKTLGKNYRSFKDFLEIKK